MIGLATMAVGAVLGSSASAHGSGVDLVMETPSSEGSSGETSSPGVPFGETTQISATSAYPGESVTISGTCAISGFPYPTDYFVRMVAPWDEYAESVAMYEPTDSEGAFELTFTVPSDHIPGVYRLSQRCNSGDQAFGPASIDFTVIGEAQPTPTPSPEAGVPFGETTWISTTSAFPGESVTISGNCTIPGNPIPDGYWVRLWLPDDLDEEGVVVSVPTDSEGAFELTLTIPADQAPGTYLLSQMCMSDDQAFGPGDIEFTVLDAAPPSATPSPTPSTSPSTTAERTTEPTTRDSNTAELAESGGTVPALWTLAGLCIALGIGAITKRRTDSAINR